MAKLPKFSDFTDVGSLMGKVKSAIENLTGPGASAATAEALAQESDPVKAKLLEVELLINQLRDIAIIQNKSISELAAAYGEVKKAALLALQPSEKPDESANTASVQPDSSQTEQKNTQSAPVETPTNPVESSPEAEKPDTPRDNS